MRGLRAGRRIVRAAYPSAEVTVLPPHRGSENRHSRAVAADGTPLFVKAYRDAGKCRVERVVLDALGARYAWLILPVSGGDTWLAFPWLDLAPVQPPSWRLLGERLADVHSCPVPDGWRTPAARWST